MAAPKGNQNARKAKEFEKAMRQALADEHGTVGKGLVKVAKQAVRAATEGKEWAIQMIADRFDGKPAQTVEGSFTHAVVSELTDEQLIAIATGSGDGDSGAPSGEEESSPVH